MTMANISLHCILKKGTKNRFQNYWQLYESPLISKVMEKSIQEKLRSISWHYINRSSFKTTYHTNQCLFQYWTSWKVSVHVCFYLIFKKPLILVITKSTKSLGHMEYISFVWNSGRLVQVIPHRKVFMFHYVAFPSKLAPLTKGFLKDQGKNVVFLVI